MYIIYFDRYEEKVERKSKRNIVSAVIQEWPIFLMGEAIIWESLLGFGMKNTEADKTTLHKRAVSVLTSMSTERKAEVYII